MAETVVLLSRWGSDRWGLLLRAPRFIGLLPLEVVRLKAGCRS